MQLHWLVVILFTAECLAETKWIWERNFNADPYATTQRREDSYRKETSSYRYPQPEYSHFDRDRYRELERLRDFERLRERERERERNRDRNRHRNRHRDREPVTVRPFTRPAGGPEDFEDYDIDDHKYNSFDQNQPNGVGVRPYALPPRPLPPIENLRPSPQNGILVGPDGPSGVIGRPNGQNIIGGNRMPLINGIQGGGNPNDLRPNPANGVLVGPGGPTGVIGRPQYGNGAGVGAVGGYPPIGPGGAGTQPGLGPQLFPQLPQGLNPQQPQGFPNSIRPIEGGPNGGPGFGPGLYPNIQGQGQGQYPGNGIYGYPSGPGNLGGAGGAGGGIGPYGGGYIYPGQYPGQGGGGQQAQQGQYGFYPAQYYPGANTGGPGGANRPYPYPYNNELGGDNYGGSGYYAPGYDEFARSASTASKTKDKDKSSIKSEDRKVKKSVDDKLGDI